MPKNFRDFCLSIVAVIVIASVITCIYVLENYEDKTQTKTLTILHTWEEGGQYYFADELGSVYLIGCWGGKGGEIRYDDMPKIRFDKLEEGHRYNVEYVLKQNHHVEHMLKKGNVRLSLGEEKMKK